MKITTHSADEKNLDIELNDFLGSPITIKCEVEVLKDNGYGRLSTDTETEEVCFYGKGLSFTMRTNLPKLLNLLIFGIYSLNFSLEFFIMICFVTNQLNISKFLPLQIRKTLISY